MEPAAEHADFESQPWVLLTATESQPDPLVLVEEPSQAQPSLNEPIGVIKPPASFADYAVIEPVRSQKKKRGRPASNKAVDTQPAQQEEEVEHDDISAALAIPGLPDFSSAVRQFMLGDGPKLSMEVIKTLSDQAVLDLLAKIPGVFLVNVDADPQQLVDSHLLDVGVYSQYKGLTLPLHRYVVDRICTEWFAKLRFSTKTNYLNAIQRFAGAHQPALTTALVLPYDGPAAAIDSLIQSAVDAEKMQLPSGTLGVSQSALTRLIAIQLGVPAEQRPVADPHAKINIKNETLPDVETRCNGGSAWNLLVQKWRRFASETTHSSSFQGCCTAWKPDLKHRRLVKSIDELNKRPENEGQPLSYLAHPVSKVANAAQIVVDRLLRGSNLKGSINSFQNAMIKLRECQLRVPGPGILKEDAWFRSTLETAGRATAKRKLAPEANSLLGTEETTTLKPHEYEHLIDSCMVLGGGGTRSQWLAAAFMSFNSAARCSDLCTMKYKALFLTTQDTYPVQHTLLTCKKDGNTKTNKYGEFRASACGRNRKAHLDAHGWLADLMLYDALTPGREVDFGDLVLNRRGEWRTIPLFHQDGTVSADGLTTLFRLYLSKAGLRNEINRTMHLMRNTAAIRAGAHSPVDIVELLGDWKSGSNTCAGSYLSKSQSSALPAHLALAGFKGPFDHYLWRADAEVPDAWVDAVMPGVRAAYKTLLEQHQGLKCHEKEIGAETFLRTLLYLGKVFWQNLPLKYSRYKECYTLAHLKGINSIMQSTEYARFAEDVLDRERRSIEKIENKERSAHNAPAVEVPKVSTKVYANHSIAFRDCKTCADLWGLWEQERPIINNIIERADAKQAHPLTVQKGRLEAVVRVIERLSEEKGSLQHGIRAWSRS